MLTTYKKYIEFKDLALSLKFRSIIEKQSFLKNLLKTEVNNFEYGWFISTESKFIIAYYVLGNHKTVYDYDTFYLAGRNWDPDHIKILCDKINWANYKQVSVRTTNKLAREISEQLDYKISALSNQFIYSCTKLNADYMENNYFSEEYQERYNKYPASVEKAKLIGPDIQSIAKYIERLSYIEPKYDFEKKTMEQEFAALNKFKVDAKYLIPLRSYYILKSRSPSNNAVCQVVDEDLLAPIICNIKKLNESSKYLQHLDNEILITFIYILTNYLFEQKNMVALQCSFRNKMFHNFLIEIGFELRQISKTIILRSQK